MTEYCGDPEDNSWCCCTCNRCEGCTSTEDEEHVE